MDAVPRETREIGIVADAGVASTAAGTARLRPLQPVERARNAARKLGLCWGVGLFCVLFPVIHFVLVPLFLVLGIYLAFTAAAVKRFVVSGSAPCPGCGRAFPLELAPERWPVKGVCEGCKRSLVIRSAAS